jgi:trimeric autotransporter adhesin
MASSVPPKRATAYTTYVALTSQADPNIFKTSPTLAAGDVKVSKDGGSYSNIGSLPSQIGTTGVLAVALTSSEMTADTVTVLFHDASGAEWQDLLLVIHTAARLVDDLAFPTTSGRSIDVDADGGVEVDSLQDGAITANAIASGAITDAKLATGAITADKIASGAITDAKIASGALTSAKFGSGAITSTVLADGALTANKIASGAITDAKFATDAITSTGLAASAANEIRDAILSDTTRFAGADIAAILADTGTDGVVLADNALTSGKIAATGANKIADHVLRRSWASAASSSDGDTKGFRSLLGAVAKLVNKLAVASDTLTIYEADDSTPVGTQAVTSSADAEVITGLDTD